MDFSSEFVALRDRMQAALDAEFVSRRNAEVAGRTAALISSFSVSTEKRMFGLIPTGKSTHAHEYRLLFAAPGLTEASLADWWQYAQAAVGELVKPDEDHSFSLVSLILASDGVDKAVQKKAKKLSREKQYDEGGWSAIRLAVVDLSEGKTYTNTSGEPLRGILKPLLQNRA